MEASKVYYTDFRCPVGTSLLDKLRRVCIAAGIKDIDMDGKFVAIKMHFGELGNLAFLRPNYAKVVADLCKEQGGLPFLTDCNTLYPGSRKNALEHLTCAQLNGFWPMTTGCQVIIADGLRGTDEAEVPVPNGEYCKTAKIGRAIMDADIFISLTHFKQVLFGHNDIFPKLEQALMGKKARDTVTLTLEPEDAFGESEPELIRSVPLNLLGDNVEPGMKVEGVPGEPSDGRFYTVIGSDENHVFLDGNHPFAGWALKFVVRVLKVEKATPEEVEEMEAPELLEVADLVKEASETKH